MIFSFVFQLGIYIYISVCVCVCVCVCVGYMYVLMFHQSSNFPLSHYSTPHLKNKKKKKDVSTLPNLSTTRHIAYFICNHQRAISYNNPIFTISMFPFP